MNSFTPTSLDHRHLPDVSTVTQPTFAAPLSRVGMEKIEMPVKLDVSGLIVPARIDAYVSLDKSEARGIHMSRLYLDVADAFRSQILNFGVIKNLLQKFLKGHSDLSREAELVARFESRWSAQRC